MSNRTLKFLHRPVERVDDYGQKAMGEEISATFDIENIDYNRESVRRIFAGMAARDKMEERIAGMRKGIQFISDRRNSITEENFFLLYKLAISGALAEENVLLPARKYRHESVELFDETQTIHTGLPAEKLETYMRKLFDYINEESEYELQKAALVHFYIAYLHPYFDGNGRMAGLLHMWYLVQRGYPGTLHVSMSR